MVESGVSYSFGYDRRGNLTREYREEELIRQYTYDSAGRMSLEKNLESGTDKELMAYETAAANGAIVSGARGALAGTGVGIPLAFATDFAAGTLGNALEQRISEGKVSAGKSVTRGLTNAAGNMFYGWWTDFADIQNKKNAEVTDNGKDDF